MLCMYKTLLYLCAPTWRMLQLRLDHHHYPAPLLRSYESGVVLKNVLVLTA